MCVENAKHHAGEHYDVFIKDEQVYAWDGTMVFTLHIKPKFGVLGNHKEKSWLVKIGRKGAVYSKRVGTRKVVEAWIRNKEICFMN
jgi:hypothetical protein